MRLNRGSGILYAAFTALALLTAATSAATASDTPPRASNPAEPANGVVTLDMEEQWRRGSEDDDLFFGLVVQALVGPGGEIYLLDTQLSEVYVLSPDGELLRTIGREGEGPGEFRRASDMLLLPDGNIGVVQRFPGSIVILEPTGEPAGTILPGDPTTGGRDMLTSARTVGDALVLHGAHMTRTDRGRLRRNFLSLYGTDGVEVREYFGRDDDFDFSAPNFKEVDQYFLSAASWDVASDGRVFAAAARNEYLITAFSPDGEPVLSFGRDYESWPRPRKMMDRLDARWRNSRRYRHFGVEQVYARLEPDILRVEIRDGEVWVLPSRGVHDQPAGVLQTWDVFTDDGRFDRQVALRAPGDPARDRVILLGDSLALVVSGFQDARDALDGNIGGEEEDDLEDATPVEVIAYAIR